MAVSGEMEKVSNEPQKYRCIGKKKNSLLKEKKMWNHLTSVQ